MCAATLNFCHLHSKITIVLIFFLVILDNLVAVLRMPWEVAAQAAGYYPLGTYVISGWPLTSCVSLPLS